MIEYFEVAGTTFSLDLILFITYLIGVAVLCYLGYTGSMESYALGVKHGQHDFNGELVRTESEGFKRGYKTGISEVIDFIKADLARADAEVAKKPVKKVLAKKVAK